MLIFLKMATTLKNSSMFQCMNTFQWSTTQQSLLKIYVYILLTQPSGKYEMFIKTELNGRKLLNMSWIGRCVSF